MYRFIDLVDNEPQLPGRHVVTMHSLILTLISCCILVTPCYTSDLYSIATQNNVASTDHIGTSAYNLVNSMQSVYSTSAVGVITIINSTPMTMVLLGVNAAPLTLQPTIQAGSSGTYSWTGTVNQWLACAVFMFVEPQAPEATDSNTLLFCFSQLVAGQTRTRIWWNPASIAYPPTSAAQYDTYNTVGAYYPYSIVAYNNYTVRMDVTQRALTTSGNYWIFSISDMSTPVMQC